MPTIDLGHYPDPLSTADIGRIFNINPKSASRHVKAGRFGTPMRTIGGRPRISHEAVTRVLRECGYEVIAADGTTLPPTLKP